MGAAALVALLATSLMVTRSLAATPPPTPTITSGPTGATTSTNATFGYSVAGRRAGLSFACSLDGAAFTTCSTNGITYRALANATHTFRVEAIIGGTAGASASRTWSVDTVAPIVTVAFPVNASTSSAADYAAGCTPIGLCGRANDATGVRSVSVSVRQGTGNYWGGTSFNSRSEAYRTATLAVPNASSSAWNLALPTPTTGTYTVHVKAVDTLNTSSANPLSITFTIAATTTTLPTPSITVAPTNPSPDTAPTFSFTDSQAGVGFNCTLDNAAATACNAGTVTYSGLIVGNHCLAVVATDPNGNRSAAASYCWSIVSAVSNITIAGNPPGSLSPGGAASAIDVSITNPFPFPIKVVAINIAVNAASSKVGCNGATNLIVVRQFSGTASLPANSTRTLSQLAPAVTSAQWPLVQMPGLPANQDACKGAIFTLTYSGTATQ